MSISRTHSALLLCTAMSLLPLAGPARAQDAASQANGTTTLEKIVVKGKRVKGGSAVADTPLATETTAATIEKKQITSIEDLGRVAQPGVSFNRSTGAVNIRGLEGDRVLTTIDGIPVRYLSDATRGATGGLDSFNFSSLSAVDVLRGADSSRAGSGALGGVLGLQTLEPEDLIQEGRDWGGVAKFTFDSADTSYEPSVAVAKKIENTSIMFQGGYKKGKERKTNGSVDSYGPTRTKADPSDYDQHNLLFKLRQDLEGGHRIGVTAESFRRDRDTNSKINQVAVLGPRDNYLPGAYFTNNATARDRISLDYSYDATGTDGLFDSAWASLYWQKQSRETGYNGYRSTTVVGNISRLNDYDENSFGLVGALQKKFETGQLNHDVTFGFDLSRSTSEQYSSGVDNCRLPYTGAFAACANLHTNQADTPKVDSSRIGFYIDDEIGFGQSGFTLTPGLRFDWVEHTPKMTSEYARNTNRPALPGEFDDVAVSPKLRAGYDVSDKVELYAQWAMGFRAPNAGELYSVFGGPGTYLRLGNPNLESETSNGFEIGANLGDEDLGGRINLFYNRYKNFIETTSLTASQAAALGYDLNNYRQGGITRGVNLDRARIYGAELSAHVRFDNGFSLRGGLAYANGKNLDNDTFLQSVSPLKGVVSAAYDTETWGVGIDWIAANGGRGKDILTNGQRTYFATPGYGIVDLTAWYEPEQVKGLRINAGIYNVFDKTYYDYATARTAGSQANEYYSEPGRTFKISLTQRF